MSDETIIFGNPNPGSNLTDEQQQRVEAVHSARSALADSSGSLLHKGSRISGEAPYLVSVAHFIATGQREYILQEYQHVETVKSVRVGDLEVTGDQ